MSLSLLSAKPQATKTFQRERAKSVPNTPRNSPTSSAKIAILRRPSSQATCDLESVKDLDYSLSHVTKLKSDEKDFNRKSVAWLGDGRLVILNHGNDELKVFDTKYHAILSKRLGEGCKAITSASDSDVAVTCARRLYFFNITHKRAYETSKCFILNGNCYGVAKSGTTFAVAVDVGTPKKSIAILDEKGKSLHIIRNMVISKQIFPLSFYTYVAVDDNKRAVYISDVKHDKLLCVSFSERLLWERELPGKPRGVCVIQDHVVVGTTNQQLILINSDGYVVKVLATLDYEPETIAYDHVTNRLAVSQYFRGWVHVYQIT